MQDDRVKIYFSQETSRGKRRYRVTVIRRRNRRRSRATKTFSDESRAREFYQAALAEHRARRELLVYDLIDMWMGEQGRRLRPGSLRHYRTMVDGLCRERVYAADLTDDDALDWYRRYQVGRAVATHQQALQLTKQMWRWALDEGLVADNPWKRVHREGIKRRGKTRLRLKETRELIAACLADGGAGAIGVLLALLLGLRRGEILNLGSRDVDEGLLWITDGKTDNAVRILQIPAEIAPLLADLAARSGESLFPFSPNWLPYHVERLCEIAGVPRVCLHGLRATHATLAIEGGAQVRDVARQLGHGSTAVTERHYIDPSSAQQAQADRFLRVLDGGKVSPRLPRGQKQQHKRR